MEIIKTLNILIDGLRTASKVTNDLADTCIEVKGFVERAEKETSVKTVEGQIDVTYTCDVNE